MTPEQIALARHALGLTRGRTSSYRNYFVTGSGSADYAPWVAMVEAGDATRRPGSELTGGDEFFQLTPRGARSVLRDGESLDPEDFPGGDTDGVEEEGTPSFEFGKTEGLEGRPMSTPTTGER